MHINHSKEKSRYELIFCLILPDIHQPVRSFLQNGPKVLHPVVAEAVGLQYTACISLFIEFVVCAEEDA